ncbi:hypothetical protein FSP39_007605 [Pinctada imbricata]|uniref:Transmembrane protein 47 n=1 Tax=Pinctada imbricata TaxID=66713 RepID=A0AA89C3Q3_PINIB|nr:hypothetical protein FSP39_007605 [Pinctada imbricata]
MDAEGMSEETEFINRKQNDPSAPTVSIETVSVVRPIKVLSFICCLVGILFNALSVASSSWLKDDVGQEGLWSKCIYIEDRDDEVMCMTSKHREWMSACRALSAFGLIICFISMVVLTIGIQTTNGRMKYKYYGLAILIMFFAAVPDVVSLIIYPVRFREELIGDYWNVGWAYIIGWFAVILKIGGGVLVFIDRNTEELVEKEVTTCPNDIEDYE